MYYDEFDVGVGGVVFGVEVDYGVFVEGGYLGVVGVLVWNIYVVKSGFEDFVFEYEMLVFVDVFIDFCEWIGELVLMGMYVVLVGVVCVVGELDFEVMWVGGIYDVDVFEVVVDGFLVDFWVGVGDVVEFVVVVLEGVWVDGV